MTKFWTYTAYTHITCVLLQLTEAQRFLVKDFDWQTLRQATYHFALTGSMQSALCLLKLYSCTSLSYMLLYVALVAK